MNKDKNSIVYQLDGKPPLGIAVPLGLQHILAMFVGNVTPIIVISNALKLPVEQKAFLIQCAMFVAGLLTLVQCFPIGPVGSKLPIVMGTSFGFLPVMLGIGAKYGLAGIFGAALVGGIFQLILGFFIKYIRKFFPPLVTGIVLLAIGISLTGTGMKYFAGGAGAQDFGSIQNIFLGSLVLMVLLIIKHYTKGLFSMSAILISLIAGYLISIPMHKVDFTPVASASWFTVPMLYRFGMEFHLDAILSMLVMFFISTVETVGNTSGITSGGLGRAATEREISGAVIADGIGTSVGAFFNALPNTSYGQNVGIITMTGVVNRFSVAVGAIFLMAAGLFPKLGGLIAVMPASVFGGAAVVMFSSMVVSGINQVTEVPLTNRTSTILAVSLGLGIGFSLVPDASKNFPEAIRMLFEGSGVAVATITAVFLNRILPEDKKNQ